MILNVENVTKAFSSRGKGKIANDHLSFTISEGEVFGLLGQNGAGKTTLVNQILGLLTPDHGEILLLGKSVLKAPAHARSICSVQPQSQVPLGSLTPKQAVTLMGKMRAGKGFNPKRVDELFEALDMTEWANVEGVKLSGGAQRLTAFCMAVVVPGQLVILDEPTNDVDPVRRRYLWQVVRSLADQGTAVILVTHNVLEAEKAVDRLAIISHGKFLAQGTPREVKGSVSNKVRIELSLVNEIEEVSVPDWAHSLRRNGSRLLFSMDPSRISPTIDWITDQVDGGLVVDYSISPTTIEDAYIALNSKKTEGVS
ncbi:multidrug ABC transporter ATP-binding protein [Robertmurraya siralis]|uniref:Multidrug ABC transporter ATP-binding protein n=1 Tax=Robertmurraya siralis TaxID=77777 RepID=A0A919WJK4_9BACI|nr:ABC transporter ATP-binding protein [Robertmurraya siralis]PAE19582.1 multidrug ABC transporter ATP-binding protein [Bacillus sp. 7504-2]GIN63236.1 multidrug ABC transporter ATP-binding protein [Robertmurraya siralis]